MAKQVVWTKTARNQRKQILEFWAEHNGNKKYSSKVSRLIRNKIALLIKFNNLGKVTNFKDVRVTVDGHFSVFYKLHDNKIIIMSIWDNRQNPRELISILDLK